MSRRKLCCLCGIAIGLSNLGMVSIHCTNNEFNTDSTIYGNGMTSDRDDFVFMFGVWAVDQEQNPIFLSENSITDDDDELEFTAVMSYWTFEGALEPPVDPGFWEPSPETPGSGGTLRTPDHYLQGFISENDFDEDGPFAVWP